MQIDIHTYISAIYVYIYILKRVGEGAANQLRCPMDIEVFINNYLHIVYIFTLLWWLPMDIENHQLRYFFVWIDVSSLGLFIAWL